MPYGMRGRYRPRARGPRPVVTKVKNQFAEETSAIASTNIDTFITSAVEQGAATKTTGIECPVGAHIRSIFVSVSLGSSAGGASLVGAWYLTIFRHGQTGTDFPAPQWTAIGLSSIRNQIWHSEMFVIGTNDAPTYRFNRQIRIPKWAQRVRAGDFMAIRTNCDNAYLRSIGVRYYYYT